MEQKSKYQKLVEEYLKAKREIEIALVNEGLGLDFKFDNFGVHVNTVAFDSSCEDPLREVFTCLAEKIAFEISERDYPTSYSQGKRFCKFMGFDDHDSKYILDACVSDEQYRDFLETERRLAAE